MTSPNSTGSTSGSKLAIIKYLEGTEIGRSRGKINRRVYCSRVYAATLVESSFPYPTTTASRAGNDFDLDIGPFREGSDLNGAPCGR